MKTVLTLFFSLIVIPFVCIAEPQDEQYEHLVAKARQMGNSEEGRAYEKHFSRAFAKKMDEAVAVCAKDMKPPYIVNLVFIVGADGTVQHIVPAPGELLSTGVAIKLKGIKVTAPPRDGWMVALSMETNELKKHRTISDNDQEPANTPLPGPR